MQPEILPSKSRHPHNALIPHVTYSFHIPKRSSFFLTQAYRYAASQPSPVHLQAIFSSSASAFELDRFRACITLPRWICFFLSHCRLPLTPLPTLAGFSDSLCYIENAPGLVFERLLTNVGCPLSCFVLRNY